MSQEKQRPSERGATDDHQQMLSCSQRQNNAEENCRSLEDEGINASCKKGDGSAGGAYQRRKHCWAPHEVLEFQDIHGEDVVEEINTAWRKCTKYPGHEGFIPLPELGFAHLPPEYRKDIYLDYIKCWADLTVRLRVRHGPDSAQSSTGTAFVTGVEYVQDYWWIYLMSADHCISNQADGKTTKVDFFYDDKDSLENKKMKTLKGLTKGFGMMRSDVCFLWCDTHDEVLIDYLHSRLKEKLRRIADIRKFQFGSDTREQRNCMVVISHPHGTSKQITVGEELNNYYQSKGDTLDLLFKLYGFNRIFYDYSTKTCKGSSGAPVLNLYIDDEKCFEQFPCLHLRKNIEKGCNTGSGMDHSRFRSLQQQWFKCSNKEKEIALAIKCITLIIRAKFVRQVNDAEVDELRNGRFETFPSVLIKDMFESLGEFRELFEDGNFGEYLSQTWHTVKPFLNNIVCEKGDVFKEMFDTLSFIIEGFAGNFNSAETGSGATASSYPEQVVDFFSAHSAEIKDAAKRSFVDKGVPFMDNWLGKAANHENAHPVIKLGYQAFWAFKDDFCSAFNDEDTHSKDKEDTDSHRGCRVNGGEGCDGDHNHAHGNTDYIGSSAATSKRHGDRLHTAAGHKNRDYVFPDLD